VPLTPVPVVSDDPGTGGRGPGNGLVRSFTSDRFFDKAGNDSMAADRAFDFATGSPLPTVNGLGDQSHVSFSNFGSRSTSNALGEPGDEFVVTSVAGFTSGALGSDLVGGDNSHWDAGNDVLWRHAEGPLSNWLGQANGGFVANEASAVTTEATNGNVHPSDIWI